MKRWGPILLLLLMLLVLGAGLWFWQQSRPPAVTPILLSDGTLVRLRGVTFGTNHVDPGATLAQKLGRFLPQAMRQRLGKRAVTMTTSRPVMVVWTTARHPPLRNVSPRHVLGGESGFAPVNSSSSISSTTPGGETIEGWGFEAFPRRSRTLTLRIYEPGPNWPDMKLAGEFTWRNPAHRRDPPWTPETLPATHTNAGFNVTLKEVVVGVHPSRLEKLQPAPNEPEAGVRATFHLSKDGQPTEDWAPASVAISDATGNQVRSTTWSSTRRDQDFVAAFRPYLWTDEPAWNLRFELSRQANFAMDELWTVPPVPLGATNLTNQAGFTTSLQDAQVRVESVLPERTGSFPDDTDRGRRTWIVRVRVTPDREDYRLTLVNALANRGATPQREGSSWGGGQHDFRLTVPTNATRLDLTLALHRSRYEEFRVKPVRLDPARTNTPARPPAR